MLRLVAYAADGVLRFPVGGGRILLGSSPDCDFVIDRDGVADLHAIVHRNGDAVEIEAVGDAPLRLNGRRVRHGRVELLDEIVVADVTLVLEDTDARSRDAGSPAVSVSEIEPAPGLEGASALRQRLLERLSSLSAWVLSDAGSARSLESILIEMLADFGGGAAYLFEGLPESDPPVRLLVTGDQVWIERTQEVLDACRRRARIGPGRTLGHFQETFGDVPHLVSFRAARALERDYFTAIVVPSPEPEPWSPELGFATAADLVVLGLVHHVGRYEPILPGRGQKRELTLVPGLVIGTSARMARLLQAMEAVADSDSNVLLLGEPGTGRELIARSLHGSGPQRHGPFVRVECEGVEPHQLEADLFGAEVAGKEGPIRREGKILLASGGTLYLRSAELLPLPLQNRLIRVLRSGSVEVPGSDQAVDVELRIIGASTEGFFGRLAEDRLRVDLAARLTQFVLPVPSLRERLEDLPLLLQTYVNRFSHETGKRVRGITTRALQALSSYPFPGNLAELENTIRQMVYVARGDAPLDLDNLPPQIRASRLQSESGARSGKLSEIVGRVERAAIAEALAEAGGNKSRAARILGLSRNGLAQKMRRYEL